MRISGSNGNVRDGSASGLIEVKGRRSEQRKPKNARRNIDCEALSINGVVGREQAECVPQATEGLFYL